MLTQNRALLTILCDFFIIISKYQSFYHACGNAMQFSTPAIQPTFVVIPIGDSISKFNMKITISRSAWRPLTIAICNVTKINPFKLHRICRHKYNFQIIKGGIVIFYYVIRWVIDWGHVLFDVTLSRVY